MFIPQNRQLTIPPHHTTPSLRSGSDSRVTECSLAQRLLHTHLLRRRAIGSSTRDILADDSPARFVNNIAKVVHTMSCPVLVGFLLL